jgi:hypothetical protein
VNRRSGSNGTGTYAKATGGSTGTNVHQVGERANSQVMPAHHSSDLGGRQAEERYLVKALATGVTRHKRCYAHAYTSWLGARRPPACVRVWLPWSASSSSCVAPLAPSPCLPVPSFRGPDVTGQICSYEDKLLCPPQSLPKPRNNGFSHSKLAVGLNRPLGARPNISPDASTRSGLSCTRKRRSGLAPDY